MPHAPPAFAYRPDIDGLRAVAVLLVVVFHFHLVSGVDSGFMGVDVFFVISGFLITTIVQRQLQADRFSVGTFWIHRIRRLAPALVATTLLTLLAGWAMLLPPDFAKLAQQTIATQLYVANIFYWRNVNYFGLQAQDVYLLHTWSLAVEEQFYIFYPLVLMAIAKWARGRVGLILSLLALLSFALNLVFVASKPQATFYLMPTRAWELLAGALLALQLLRPRRPDQFAAQACGAAGFGCLCITVFAYREGIAFPGYFALLPVAAAVLLILAGSLGANAASRLLSLTPVTYIGKISYPLYLVHWPVNVFAAAALGADYGWGWRFTMLALSMALAALIYHGVEGPMRRWFAKRDSSAVLKSYGVALVAALGVSAAVLATGGAPMRYSERVARLASFVADQPPSLRECEFSGNAPLNSRPLCRLGSAVGEPTWLVYGDSHAWAASGAVDLWLKRTGKSAQFVFIHACPPVQGVYLLHGGNTCFDFNAAALTHLRAQAGITDVLLISTWLQAKEAILTDASKQPFTVAESVALFDRRFGETLSELKRTGKRVYLWEPLPGARELVPQAMARSELASKPLDIDITKVEYLSRYDFFFAALRKHQNLITGTFSPASELCGSGRCVTQLDGLPLYFDNGHLAYSTRVFWADALTRQLAR